MPPSYDPIGPPRDARFTGAFSRGPMRPWEGGSSLGGRPLLGGMARPSVMPHAQRPVMLLGEVQAGGIKNSNVQNVGIQHRHAGPACPT